MLVAPAAGRPDDALAEETQQAAYTMASARARRAMRDAGDSWYLVAPNEAGCLAIRVSVWEVKACCCCRRVSKQEVLADLPDEASETSVVAGMFQRYVLVCKARYLCRRQRGKRRCSVEASNCDWSCRSEAAETSAECHLECERVRGKAGRRQLL